MFTDINESDARAMMQENKDLGILDVRTPGEWMEGVIPGALTLNIMDQGHFMEEVGKLDKSKPWLLVCRSGNRSYQAGMFMQQQGFSALYNLSGGMMAWRGETTTVA